MVVRVGRLATVTVLLGQCGQRFDFSAFDRLCEDLWCVVHLLWSHRLCFESTLRSIISLAIARLHALRLSDVSTDNSAIKRACATTLDRHLELFTSVVDLNFGALFIRSLVNYRQSCWRALLHHRLLEPIR